MRSKSIKPHLVKLGRNKFCSRPCIVWPKEPIDDRLFRFLTKIDRTKGCILWMGARDRDGYGQLENTKAHRIAYELLVGDIPPGHQVCHTCDNPPCCNPAHLFPGTQAVNSADMTAKGRQIKGERHHSAKLTEEQVREIRQRFAQGGISKTALAKEFSVTDRVILLLVLRKTWKHVV